MYTHTVNFVKAKRLTLFAQEFGAEVINQFSAPAHHRQVVAGSQIFGKELACATLQTEGRLGEFLGVTDFGGNPIQTLPDDIEEKFGIQAASLNK